MYLRANADTSRGVEFSSQPIVELRAAVTTSMGPLIGSHAPCDHAEMAVVVASGVATALFCSSTHCGKSCSDAVAELQTLAWSPQPPPENMAKVTRAAAVLFSSFFISFLPVFVRTGELFRPVVCCSNSPGVETCRVLQVGGK